VAHLVRDEGVAGSNPATPTMKTRTYEAPGSDNKLTPTDIPTETVLHGGRSIFTVAFSTLAHGRDDALVLGAGLTHAPS
jgi:hypothetical protein